MKPKYRKGKKKRGGQPGHTGRTREPLPEPDRTREHMLPCCPDCHGPLKRTGDKRSRRSEDIPEDLKPVITEDILHRDYCPACQKRVEPKLPDVLPRCTLGNRTLVLSAMLHFLQGLTLGQIVDTFNFHLRMKVTPGGLVQMWHRLAKYGNERLTFLWHADVPSDNNAGERAIRPAVMIRKNSYCNHSDRGALTQSVLMTVFRTLRLRGRQPLATILNALAAYATTGNMPSMPQLAE